MNTKILVIGQAPPAVKQEYPYDTTYWYDWLNELTITKEESLDIFDYEAVYNLEFLGKDSNGHVKPTKEQCDLYWNLKLKDKVNNSDKIIVLGNVAKEYLQGKLTNKQVLELIHPSKRNYLIIQKNYNSIITKLTEFVSK